MKKLILILAAVLSFSALSAQDRNGNYYDRNHQGDQAYNDYKDNRYNDRNDRQAAYDRMNRDYDQRINNYRNDRSMNRYERQRRIDEAERERQQKSKSFGKGVIIGGLAALVLGAILSN